MCHGIIIIATAAILNVSQYFRYCSYYRHITCHGIITIQNAQNRTNCIWENDLFLIPGIYVSAVIIIYVTEIQFTLTLPPPHCFRYVSSLILSVRHDATST